MFHGTAENGLLGLSPRCVIGILLSSPMAVRTLQQAQSRALCMVDPAVPTHTLKASRRTNSNTILVLQLWVICWHFRLLLPPLLSPFWSAEWEPCICTSHLGSKFFFLLARCCETHQAQHLIFICKLKILYFCIDSFRLLMHLPLTFLLCNILYLALYSGFW